MLTGFTWLRIRASGRFMLLPSLSCCLVLGWRISIASPSCCRPPVVIWQSWKSISWVVSGLHSAMNSPLIHNSDLLHFGYIIISWLCTACLAVLESGSWLNYIIISWLLTAGLAVSEYYDLLPESMAADCNYLYSFEIEPSLESPLPSELGVYNSSPWLVIF
jgi:hypothetical protein